jgi:hypothetical protein
LCIRFPVANPVATSLACASVHADFPSAPVHRNVDIAATLLGDIVAVLLADFAPAAACPIADNPDPVISINANANAPRFMG